MMNLQKKLGIFTILISLFISLIYTFFFIRPENINFFRNPRILPLVTPIYTIKTAREYIQSFFIFGEEDNLHWNLILAEKRLVEAGILKKNNLYYAYGKRLEEAKTYQRHANSQILKLKDKINTRYLIDMYEENQRKIKNLQDR